MTHPSSQPLRPFLRSHAIGTLPRRIALCCRKLVTDVQYNESFGIEEINFHISQLTAVCDLADWFQPATIEIR